jgi:hypothetical protein
MIFKMMEPLYEAHAELKPKGWADHPESEQ